MIVTRPWLVFDWQVMYLQNIECYIYVPSQSLGTTLE